MSLEPAEQTHLNHPKYRADIDGLRAIAILFVVGFHTFPIWIKGGFIGVDIFFIISGFLISTIIFGSLDRNSFSFIEFFIRRINRIFPALLLVLIASFAFGWFALLADEYMQLGKHIAGGAGFISNFLLWNESGYFDNSAETKPLLHLWSLGIEEQFYIVWPLLLWFAWKLRLNLLIIAISVGIISFSLNVGKASSDTIAAFYSPQTRFWELMAGSVLAYMTLHKQNIFPKLRRRLDTWLGPIVYVQAPEENGETLRNVQSLLGALLIVIGVIVITKERYFPGWWALLPTLGSVMIISAGAQAWLNRVILSNCVLVWFGLISFPLYLWHWPLLSFARILENEAPSSEIRIAAVLISIVLAWLTYRLIEKPIRFSKYGKNKTIALLVLMVVVGYMGYNDYKRDGYKFRDAEKVMLINTFELSYRQSCYTLTGNRYADDWCNIGTSNNSNPKIVVIGDSFSNSYSTMLNAYTINSINAPPFLQYGRGQCPSLNDYGPGYCRDITTKAFEYIKNHSSVEKVVLASNWPAYFNGKYFPWASHKETAEAFKVAFEKTIQDYQSIGKKVIIFLATPTGFNPRSCIIRPVRIADRNSCNLSKDAAIDNDGKYRAYLIPKLQFKGISYFDPFGYFCDDENCKTTDGAKILFSESAHLSIFGGEYLATKGKGRLDELLLK